MANPRGIIDLGLGRIKHLLAELGNPERLLKRIVHVTGTNGKGSTVEMVATGLSQLGWKVGVFTSPFLIFENDAIRVFEVDNIMSIPECEWNNIQSQVASITSTCMRDDVPTDFEVLVAVALVYFSALDLDAVIVEVGMGGREDATNIFQRGPTVCVLTGVALDHQKFLGETVEEICENKCGIIHEGSIVVASGQMSESCRSIVTMNASSNNASHVHFVKTDTCTDIISPLNGAHQRVLAGIATSVIQCLMPHVARNDILAALSSTVLPGRLERRFDRSVGFPLILDGAHNPESAVALRDFVKQELESTGKKNIIWILACSKGRENIIPILVHAGDVCVPIEFQSYQEQTAQWIQAIDVDTLADCVQSTGATIVRRGRFVESALRDVRSEMNFDVSLVVVAGSLYLVRNYLRYVCSMANIS